ncbi:MAG: 2-polyprenyl-3-methyl-6-methoxy-1,4-benzoquinone monooxygenase [Burkholderiaceae bacterium]
MTIRNLGLADRLLAGAQRAFDILDGRVQAERANPAGPLAEGEPTAPVSPAQKRMAGALMRVNHVGEICAQALYEGQAITARDARARATFEQAAREERDHLAWLAQRLDELDDRPSLLNPFWYAGSLTLGALAGLAGDRVSMGFMDETERQVEAHLDSHLSRLPADDQRSRAIVTQMKHDEAQHAATARRHGAARMPWPVRAAMRATARVMTGTAHYL